MAQPARLTSHLLAHKGTALPAAGSVAANLALAQALQASRAGQARPRAPDAGSLPSPPDHRPAARRDGKVKMTVRLDPDQHGQLRILAARRRCTSQELILRALDAYIQGCGDDCACLRQSRSSGARN